MNRFAKEIEKCTLRSKRFKQLKKCLHDRGIYKCSTKWSMERTIRREFRPYKEEDK